VLQGQQQNKGLLIIKVGHGFQTLYIVIFLCQMFVGVCWRFQSKRGSWKPSRVWHTVYDLYISLHTFT
jgi:hypothetical protein